MRHTRSAQPDAPPKSDPAASRICASLVAAEDKGPALLALSKHVRGAPASATQIWGHFGIPAVLLQEIIGTYAGLQGAQEMCISASVVPALEILQGLCASPEIRNSCIAAQIPLYLYPILNLAATSDELEAIKAQALALVFAMIRDEDPGAIEFFKNTELVPLCLRNMDMGREPTKLAAIRTFYAIICDRGGLEYACQTYDRFMATSMVLNSILVQLEALKSPRLLEMVLRVYLKLCDMDNARVAFRKNKPAMLFAEYIRDMMEAHESLRQVFDEFMKVLS